MMIFLLKISTILYENSFWFTHLFWELYFLQDYKIFINKILQQKRLKKDIKKSNNFIKIIIKLLFLHINSTIIMGKRLKNRYDACHGLGLKSNEKVNKILKFLAY